MAENPGGDGNKSSSYGWLLLILVVLAVLAVFVFVPAWFPWSS